MHQPGQMPPAQEGAGEAMPETEERKAERMVIVEAFAEQIKDKRKAAIEGRRQSGIEDIWAEDEEHYEGVDDANRGSTKMVKGKSMTDAPRQAKETSATRSTVFLNITRPYVDAAAARVSDMLLPTDDRNFALRHTPVPELTAMLEDKTPVQAADAGLPQPAAPAGAQPPQGMLSGLRTRIAGMFGSVQGVPPATPPQQPVTVADQAAAVIDKAKKAAERAQQEIDDWLTEARYHAEVRQVIEGAAKVGTGILKGPIPQKTRKRAARQLQDGSWTVEVLRQVKPQSRFVSHWNFYPDPNCGDNIHNGAFTFECDDITAKGLRDLKGTPGYIPEMIDLVLEEGPCSAVDGTRKLKEGEKVTDKDLFQIWYFHGEVSSKDMEAAGCKCGSREVYPCLVTMVNDRVIKVTLSPLDSGEFPYDVMVWQARKDHWAGTGVARQMRTCQKGAVAGVRNLMDNAGLSAGPQIIIDRNKLVPANGRWELSPRKVWYTKTDEELEDVRKAFWIVNIETRQQELLAIIQFWLAKAEEVTGLPMLLQGQMGMAAQTDKVGIANIMNNNGSTVLRRIARNFDDRITEPHIGRYYEFLLMYGPDEAKGDFTIDARGSSALVERELQAQQLVQIVGLALNPAYALDPEQVMREFLKSLRFDPKALELTDEKKKELASRKPPEDPRVTAAKIMAQAAKERNDDTLVSKAQLEKMRQDGAANIAAQERSLKEALAGIEYRLGMAEISSEERQNLEVVKARLADTSMKLITQKDLFVGGAALSEHQRRNPAPQVAQPGAEPPQRAPAGEAFTQ
jgi:hypothetical protein